MPGIQRGPRLCAARLTHLAALEDVAGGRQAGTAVLRGGWCCPGSEQAGHRVLKRLRPGWIVMVRRAVFDSRLCECASERRDRGKVEGHRAALLFGRCGVSYHIGQGGE